MTPAQRTDLRHVLGVVAGDEVRGQRLPNQIPPPPRPSADIGTHRAPLTTFSEARESPNGQPLVLCVYSSKGGVGKTTLATNLSARMAHHLGLEVLLLDLDVSFPDVGPRIHQSAPTVVDALLDPELSAVNIRRWLHRESDSGFWALLGPLQEQLVAHSELLTPHAYGRVLGNATDFDVVVLDTPVELSNPLVSEFALRLADAVCFIVTNERATLVDARRALDTATGSLYRIVRTKFGIAVNQSMQDVGVDAAEIHAMLGNLPLVATIPDDRDLHVSAANDASMVALSCEGAVLTALDRIIGSLLPTIAPLPSADLQLSRRLPRLQHDLERPRFSRGPRWRRK
jgi:MinD-like ATPase involved in chromosome partitioning or flagellar assembly